MDYMALVGVHGREAHLGAGATRVAVLGPIRVGVDDTVARLRDRIETIPHGWGDVPALVARGSAVVVVGLIGAGAAVAAVALFARAGQIVAL